MVNRLTNRKNQVMSRYINDIDTTKQPDTVNEITDSFMRREGFEKTDYDGSKVWKKGHGFIAPQYIIVKAAADTIHIEAWIKFALLPGVYMGEMGTEGVFGALPKRHLRARLEQLEELLRD